MTAEEMLRAGNLPEALSLLQDQVRKDPSDAKLRTFLFQLLCVRGEWDRALTQLKVTGELDALAIPMVQTYREALRCEVLRKKIFAGEISPMIFGDPEEWLALLIESLKLVAAGEYEKAADARVRAFEAAPTTTGEIDGDRFEWIADADVRLGPVLEAIVNGKSYWIPVHRIREIVVDVPADLRDAVWMPVTFTWSNGGQTVGLVPTRYPGSETSEDNLIRLARRTDWEECGPDFWRGSGQRMFATDLGEKSLMDVRRILLDTGDGTAAESTESTEATGG